MRKLVYENIIKCNNATASLLNKLLVFFKNLELLHQQEHITLYA